jgi:hypothetical protein
MTISRGKMKRQLYMGGGIMDAVPREQYGLGSVFKGVTNAVKKVAGGVKDIVSSDVGKMALLAGAGMYAGGLGPFASGARFGNVAGAGFLPNLFGASTIGNLGDLAKGGNALSLGKSASGFGNIAKFAGLAGVAGFLTSTLGMSEEQATEELTRDPSKYLELYYRNLNPPTADTNSEQYEQEVRDFVSTNTSEYKADGGIIGGRMQYSDGTMSPDEYFSGKEKYMKEKQMEDMIREYERYMRDKNINRDEVAMGGRIGYQDAGPVLPEDPTKPVNPFAPKPTGPVLPDRMASAMGDESDDIAIQLFGKPVKDLNPSEFQELQEEIERLINKFRSQKPKEGRGLAALGGRMNYAIGDSASQNAMQAASVEGLPVRQNPKGVQELDL